MKIWLCTFLVVIGAVDAIRASEMPNHPLTFNHWKRVQIHSSETQVVSKSNEINQLKKEIAGAVSEPEKATELTKQLKNEEVLQKKNLEKLQFSKELTFEEYFDVYLKQYAHNPEALKFIAERLSKHSVAYLLERSMLGEKKTPVKAHQKEEGFSKDKAIARPTMIN